jgi:hypothetical protein
LRRALVGLIGGAAVVFVVVGIFGITPAQRKVTASGDVYYACPPGTSPHGIYPFIGCW